ncbi:peptidyl-prolyl cis-trans isomerase CYP59 isoform X1 [Brachypodium distachyon]|uniref:peptidyl-prolyl cis-trans isomerase CYP59 isoform X1 n=1 Tax=Brachypodium distachyon TaxID=15368 RepID=UPI000D0D004B|nr:peptidyl-prolyl cis-trans isomerase CYP59 isoform X1 [Brachypodium distachyon]|eukprot:XP_024317384.1 peptidyl-prolyl cis-trans isomerase CYP59 isoform X1 [Brachypodium distachyon]
MSVLIVTSVGDIELDLHTDLCPLTTKNFLKLCKMKYYNGCLFHKVEKDFLAQSGDPTGTGSGGDSVYKFLYGDQARFFNDEIRPELRHSKTGTVAMASAGENCNASQFYITLRDEVDYLDDKHTVFGTVAEGFDTLTKINEAYVDDKGRPFKNIRIKHTYILDDPFDDPPQLAELIPDNSPLGKPHDEVAEERLEDSWVPLDETVDPEQLEEMIRSKEAHANAVILESVGDIPDAEVKPPDNVLFVCKLNPVTQDEDLYTIFSRFGTVTSAEIIRDFKTGDSLCYAFIVSLDDLWSEFEVKEACERAYFKMDNCLIDDRRIHVDFSQSVSKLWGQFRQSKRNANKDGCFKCGAPDHLARDCDQDAEQKNKGPNYVLKDDNTQRGSNNRRSYDLVFDADTAGQQDRHQNTDRRKIQKVDDRRSGLPPWGDRDRNSRDRNYSDEKGRRQDGYHRSGDRSSGSYDDRDYKQPESKSRNRADDKDYRRRSGAGRYDRDRSDGERRHRDDLDRGKSDHHKRDESGRSRARSPDADRHRREDVGHRETSRHRERRHRDDR